MSLAASSRSVPPDSVPDAQLQSWHRTAHRGSRFADWPRWRSVARDPVRMGRLPGGQIDRLVEKGDQVIVFNRLTNRAGGLEAAGLRE